MKALPLVLFGLGAVAALAGPARGELGDREPSLAIGDMEQVVRQRLRGTWAEWEGNDFRQEEDIWWDFLNPQSVTPNLAVATYIKHESQQITYTLRLNVRQYPMWLDMHYYDGGRARVQLGIFRFEGNRLVLIEGEHVDAAAWEKTKGKLPRRPWTFQPVKGSGYKRRILVAY
jgi:hypothetical protein